MPLKTVQRASANLGAILESGRGATHLAMPSFRRKVPDMPICPVKFTARSGFELAIHVIPAFLLLGRLLQALFLPLANVCGTISNVIAVCRSDRRASWSVAVLLSRVGHPWCESRWYGSSRYRPSTTAPRAGARVGQRADQRRPVIRWAGGELVVARAGAGAPERFPRKHPQRPAGSGNVRHPSWVRAAAVRSGVANHEAHSAARQSVVHRRPCR